MDQPVKDLKTHMKELGLYVRVMGSYWKSSTLGCDAM